MSSIPVYTGRWADYSRGPILGDTLTIEVKWGGYLIAALATFVGLVGTALWTLIAFAVHQLRAKPGSHDEVYFQHQIIYRNDGSPVHAFLDLLKICFYWRKRKETGRRVGRLRSRSFFAALPPLLVFAAFTAAGLFIAEIATSTYASNSVKVASSRCGTFLFDTTTFAGESAAILKAVNDTLNARSYAKNCYSLNSPFADCSLYPVPRLPYISSPASCPFGIDPSGEGSCLSGAQSSLQMDTGLLDTSDYFGINAAKENRLLFRKRVTCSPIRVHDYVFVLKDSDIGYPILQYNMGYSDGGVDNYTYLYDAHARADLVAYQLTSTFALDGDNDGWHPVPALVVANADVSAHFMASNTVQYLAPVYDPWFSATQVFNDSVPSLPLIVYGPDAFVNVMACTDQYQICNPNSNPYDCTVVGSIRDLNLSLSQIGLNDYQMATALRLNLVIPLITTYATANDLGSTALLARDRLTGLLGLGLPNNQWQLEVQGWFEVSLAKLQLYVVEYAANVADLGPYGYVVAPSADGDPVEKAAVGFCSNQRIRNTGAYQSFSFLGLMIVVCVGTSIILLSFIVEPLVSCVRDRRPVKARDYREIARIADHKLQLHRMTLSGAGYHDGWENTMDQLPITGEGFAFPVPLRRTVHKVHDYYYPPAETSKDDRGPLGHGDDSASGDGHDTREPTPPIVEGGGGNPAPDLLPADGADPPVA